MAARKDGSTGGSITSLIAAGDSITIAGPTGGPGALRILAAAAGTVAFRLDILISPDGGATWVIYKSAASANGNDGTYTKSAELDQYVPSLCRIDLKNTDGASTLNVVYDVKFFNVNQL